MLYGALLMALPAFHAWAQTASAILSEARQDQEIADHFGLVDQPPVTIGTYGGKLTIAADIVSTFGSTVWDLGKLNQLATENDLYSPDIYGKRMLLRDRDFIKLVELASGGTLRLAHEARVIGRVPEKELKAAEASPNQYIILGVFDHGPLTIDALNWSKDGKLSSITVSNPVGPGGDRVLPIKALTTFDPAVIDRWDFYVLEQKGN